MKPLPSFNPTYMEQLYTNTLQAKIKYQKYLKLNGPDDTNDNDTENFCNVIVSNDLLLRIAWVNWFNNVMLYGRYETFLFYWWQSIESVWEKYYYEGTDWFISRNSANNSHIPSAYPTGF